MLRQTAVFLLVPLEVLLLSTLHSAVNILSRSAITLIIAFDDEELLSVCHDLRVTVPKALLQNDRK